MEILLVTSMLGMILLVTLNGWTRFRRHTVVRSSARLAGLYLHHARMDAVYDGVNHFVVLDPDASTIEIYADTGTVSGSFDSTDVRVERSLLDPAVLLALPDEPATLTHPVTTASLTAAWDLPLPDSSARWGSQLRGVMATPTGRIQSAEATPSTILNGAMVFSDAAGNTAAVTLQGQTGSVGIYVLEGGAWRSLQ